ncbi:TRADD-N-associated membrane domain-containing protein [Streptomyces zaomyceticus]|uniref:TRADD-N-associated membrane domain-containing protein n=1 Tax=Streptomyces zaomyceticus TaxID=68286 RepID=UPI00352BF1F2
MVDPAAIGSAVIGFTTVLVATIVGRKSAARFAREQEAQAKRLRAVVMGDRRVAVGGTMTVVHGSLSSSPKPTVTTSGQASGSNGSAPSSEPSKSTAAGRQRIDDDRFAELLIEYYAYGLTQARRSFLTSQIFSAMGAGVLIFGIALAIWRAETSGDMYAGIVTSCSGVVATIIGHLFHRRADLALAHMAKQTDALRDDMRAERDAEQAVLLLAEVEDPEVKTRLQAGLIMKLSGAEMPPLGSSGGIPAPRELPADGQRVLP